MRIPLILILSLLGCGAAPTRGTAEAKATRDAQPSSGTLELAIRTEAGPGDLESAVITSPGIQQCLRQGIDPFQPQLAIVLVGTLTANGGVMASEAQGGSASLNHCLVAALQQIRAQPGHPGSFRMLLGRGKGFTLDLGGPKKFE